MSEQAEPAVSPILLRELVEDVTQLAFAIAHGAAVLSCHVISGASADGALQGVRAGALRRRDGVFAEIGFNML